MVVANTPFSDPLPPNTWQFVCCFSEILFLLVFPFSCASVPSPFSFFTPFSSPTQLPGPWALITAPFSSCLVLLASTTPLFFSSFALRSCELSLSFLPRCSQLLWAHCPRPFSSSACFSPFSPLSTPHSSPDNPCWLFATAFKGCKRCDFDPLRMRGFGVCCVHRLLKLPCR